MFARSLLGCLSCALGLAMITPSAHGAQCSAFETIEVFGGLCPTLTLGGFQWGAPQTSQTYSGFRSGTSLVRRRLPIFLVVIPCALTLGLLYLLTTPPSYTAVARMLIDTRKVPAFQQQQQTNGDSMIDTVAVATQVEILTSDNVSKAVIKDLKLTEDPEFVGPGGGLIGMLVKSIADLFDSGSSEAVSETQLKRRALAAFAIWPVAVMSLSAYPVEPRFLACLAPGLFAAAASGLAAGASWPGRWWREAALAASAVILALGRGDTRWQATTAARAAYRFSYGAAETAAIEAAIAGAPAGGRVGVRLSADPPVWPTVRLALRLSRRDLAPVDVDVAVSP